MDKSTSSSRILLHIGLPKTGTTTLQELVFSAHPDIRYFGQTNLWHDPDAKTVLRALLLGDDAEMAAARRILATAAQQHAAVVISDEALSLGEFMLRATRWPIRSDHIETARRAHAILGNAHVLIVLRDQADWLESWHRQGLKSGKYTEIEYQAWLDRDLGVAGKKLLTLLQYDALYSAYCHVFGPQQVHVRHYEQYRHHFEDLAAECAEIIAVDIERARRLLFDGKARNVTGASFMYLPSTIKRLISDARVRRVVDALPVSMRRSLRSLLVRERTFPLLSEADRVDIRDYFAAGNVRLHRALELRDRTGRCSSISCNENL